MFKNKSMFSHENGQLLNKSDTCNYNLIFYRIGIMVFNATFNNISVISWLSVLLVEGTGVPGENHRPVTSR